MGTTRDVYTPSDTSGEPPTLESGSPRSVRWAVGLSLVCAGLGHVYAGRTLRGFAVLALMLLAVHGLPFGTARLGLPLPAWVAWGVPILLMLGQAFDAAGIARRAPPAVESSFRRFVGGLAYVAVAVLALDSARAWISEPYSITASSMAPTLLPGDSVSADRTAYWSTPPERGDIVVFRSPDDPSRHYVKRIVGLPRERVVISGKEITVDGQRLEHQDRGDYTGPGRGSGAQRLFEERTPEGREYSILLDPRETSRSTPHDWTVPADHYVLLGDNRLNSRDSRTWRQPFVSRSLIVGKVTRIYLSLDPGTHGLRTDRIGEIE